MNDTPTTPPVFVFYLLITRRNRCRWWNVAFSALRGRPARWEGRQGHTAGSSANGKKGDKAKCDTDTKKLVFTKLSYNAEYLPNVVRTLLQYCWVFFTELLNQQTLEDFTLNDKLNVFLFNINHLINHFIISLISHKF